MTKRTSLFFIITVPFGTFPSISCIHITVFFHAIHFYNQQYQRSTIICLHVQVNRKYFLKYFKRTVLVLNRLCHVESFSIIHLRYQKDRIRQRNQLSQKSFSCRRLFAIFLSKNLGFTNPSGNIKDVMLIKYHSQWHELYYINNLICTCQVHKV